MPVPLYGVAIQEAAASGDLKRMKQIAVEAERYVGKTGDIGVALKALKIEIAKLERGPRKG